MIWNGSSFDVGSVSTQFVSDVSGNYYLYEQNYNGFFPVTYANNALTYNGNYQPIALPAGTSLDVATSLNSYIPSVEAAILNGRRTSFQQNPSNIQQIFTQNPGAIIASTIASAASGSGIGAALEVVAPFLTNVNLNFGIHDMLTSWANGPQTISTLSNLISNLQLFSNNQSASVQSITDFKTKLLKQQALAANEISKLQQQINTYQSSNTFTFLASAFPNEFGPLLSIMSNHNTMLALQLSRYLPIGALSSVLPNILGISVGNFIPAIINPMDKIFNDINVLSSFSSQLTNAALPSNGFGSVGAQNNYINQLNSIITNTLASVPIKSPTGTNNTNLVSLFESLNQYASQQLGQTTNSTTPAQQAVINAINTHNVAVTASMPASALANPANGGSLTSAPFFGLLLTESDQTIINNLPVQTQSPDPVLAATQTNINNTNNQNSKYNTTRQLPRGNGINIFLDVPLRPRAIMTDSSLGDYQASQNIPI